MKKIISVILALLMLAGIFVMPASAVKLSAGTEAIRASFESGKSALDYVYFSPVNDENDNIKYPLVLWLHGNSSGDYPGHQLENSDIHKFACDEFQARFCNAGGAFLLLPRDNTKDIALAWDTQIEAAMETMIDFVEEYKDNIDINRIYVGGNSMGGKGVYKIAANYPNVFAAIFPLSPVYIPTKADINALKNTAVWVFTNDNDRYPQTASTAVKNYFNQIVSSSAHPENCRWTCFDTYYRPDGSNVADEVHNTWTPVLNDLFMDNGREYLAMTTVDGNGEKISLTYPQGFIHWLSSQALEESSLSLGSKVSFFQKVIQFITSVFNAILSIFGL